MNTVRSLTPGFAAMLLAATLAAPRAVNASVYLPERPAFAWSGESAATASEAAPDTMTFTPDAAADSAASHDSGTSFRLDATNENEWLRAPIGGDLLTHPDPWRSRHPHGATDLNGVLDYNRVDLLRYGLWYQAQNPETMLPRLGARLEYATGRRRVLYGVQLEQPLLPTARFVLGVDMSRRTVHPELQQSDDVENSLALLIAHEDWRDYFEREGIGAYLSWRVPDFSTVSVHLRRDQWRSLTVTHRVKAWLHNDRPLRANPAIDDGESHSAIVRLERLAHRTQRTRGGLYHWIEIDRTGGSLGGDFDYTRAVADVRSVMRLTPASTFSVRAVGGAAVQGTLPRQKRFALGGVDGLRAHPLGALAGDHMAMTQAEYVVGLWQLQTGGFEGGLHALVFADAGAAWDDPNHGWAVGAQKFAVDGGFGLATGENGVRVTFARNLQDADSPIVVALRMQRPF